MIILGIDPGYAIVGYGVISFNGSCYKAIEFGAIFTEPDISLPERLEIIYNRIESIINRIKPDAISIESLYFQNNQKTAIMVAEARGVILLVAQMNKIKISEYTPLQVKTIVTGYGKAKKPQVMDMTKRLLRLKEMPKPDDTADALAIAICHANVCGSELKLKIISEKGKNKDVF